MNPEPHMIFVWRNILVLGGPYNEQGWTGEGQCFAQETYKRS